MSPSSDLDFLTWALSGDSADHLKKAAKKCRALLQKKPNSAAFLHLMGVIELRLNHPVQARPWVEKGLVVLPKSAELHCLYAQILAVQKIFDEAIVAFRRAIALKPDYAPAFHGLGLAFRDCGDADNETRAYHDALAIDPNFSEALNDLGICLKNKGDIEGAEKCFSRAIAARPDYPYALNNLGFIHFTLGNVGSAEELYRRALALKPDYPDALNNLAVVLHNRGARDECISLVKNALALRPDYPDGLCNLGIFLNHGGLFQESIALYRKALTLQPNHPEALNNLGNALKNSGRVADAVDAYEKAISLQSNNAQYHNNLAMALLAAGRLEEGWREFEWRWKTTQFAGVQAETGRPRWQGEAAAGRTLLVRAEQGFGDTLQFCRFAPPAAARGLRVVLEVQPALVRLLTSVRGVSQVVAHGDPLPDFDLVCPMMSLPLAFGIRLETIPADIPYIAAEPGRVESWKARLSDGGGGLLKVGLAWAGSSRVNSPDLVAADRRRSICPELLTPLVEAGGVRFYSLQKGGPAAPGALGLIDLMDGCEDFADTAALVANLDLVISVDTAVVHLAGALGKPVWVLNRFDSCWRWQRDREESPWYPTLRLLHQPAPGDWKSVVARACNELRKLTERN